MTPTALSLRYLRDFGYHCEVVEHWVPYTRIKRDLWGWCDILAIGYDILAVQTTTKSNMSARRKKILASDTFAKVRAANVIPELHGWAKDKKGHWQVTCERL